MYLNGLIFDFFFFCYNTCYTMITILYNINLTQNNYFWEHINGSSTNDDGLYYIIMYIDIIMYI